MLDPKIIDRVFSNLFCIRHGQSEGNTRLLGELVYSYKQDQQLKLTDKGKKQAKDCGLELKKLIEKEEQLIKFEKTFDGIQYKSINELVENSMLANLKLLNKQKREDALQKFQKEKPILYEQQKNNENIFERYFKGDNQALSNLLGVKTFDYFLDGIQYKSINNELIENSQLNDLKKVQYPPNKKERKKLLQDIKKETPELQKYQEKNENIFERYFQGDNQALSNLLDVVNYNLILDNIEFKSIEDFASNENYLKMKQAQINPKQTFDGIYYESLENLLFDSKLVELNKHKDKNMNNNILQNIEKESPELQDFQNNNQLTFLNQFSLSRLRFESQNYKKIQELLSKNYPEFIRFMERKAENIEKLFNDPQEVKDLNQLKKYKLIFQISPYVRTKETFDQILKALQQKNDPNIISLGSREESFLREQEFGNLQQPFTKLIRQLKGTNRQNPNKKEFQQRQPTGESGADVQQRCNGFLNNFRQERYQLNQTNINYVFVYHGLMMRLSLMAQFKWTVHEFEEVENPANCAIQHIKWTSNKYIIGRLAKKRIHQGKLITNIKKKNGNIIPEQMKEVRDLNYAQQQDNIQERWAARYQSKL